LLKLLVDGNLEGKFPSTSDYAGSLFSKFDCEFLILDPLEQLVTVPYGKHVFTRYFNKFLKPEGWITIPDFESQWEVFHPAKTEEILSDFATCTFMSFDIETKEQVDEGGTDGLLEKVITCCGFTAVWLSQAGIVRARTVVIPYTDMFNITVARKLQTLPVPKAAQNGKYDIAYLLRYRSPVTAYTFDTINMFHSWYSELPKDLGFIPTYMLRSWIYHKDEKYGGDEYQYYRYNAKDCFSTAMSVVALLYEMPEWAMRNYLMEFPLVFPCILAEARGLKLDLQTMTEQQKLMEASFTKELVGLRTMVNNQFFNPGSPPQVKKLFEILGCGDLKGTGKIQMDKASARHPLNELILGRVKKYREDRKMYGTYTDPSKAWKGRMYYALNPHGTDTGRLASKESHFWCGWQIQNIPRDRKDIQIKDSIVSDDGFYFGEADGEQAEARDTAYLSGDTKLIAAVEGNQDYHGLNASDFFAVPYSEIVRSTQDEDGEWSHETLDKDLRDLSKRTNHGANYNMGEGVMVDTMGIKNVLKAKAKLGLPASWGLKRVTGYLLDRFAEKYAVVKGDWYDKVEADVANTGMLVSPTGWTRLCFGNPSKNKRDLNRYVAHPPQNLNAMVLNKAWLAVFYNIWLPNQDDFKLCAQIHDSILFQYRIGRIDLAYQVKKLMEIPVDVTDTFGITRTLVVPVALKGEATRWSKLKTIKPPKELRHG
jgi:DNA polymerase I-like protein with 3'-5' exonuclease and polymerase domains